MKRAAFLLAVVLLSTFFTPGEAYAKDGGRYGKERGLAGPILFAPAVTLIGVPSPFRFGLEVKAWNIFGVGFDYGFLPAMSFSDVHIQYNSWRATGRLFPFKGAFFIGVGYGKQNLSGASANIIVGNTVNYAVEIQSTILTPHIGWRWTWSSGFFFGMEYGVQLVSDSTSTFSSDAPAIAQSQPEYVNEKNNIEEQARKLGRQSLPHFGLIQLGYYF